ncbi:MAG: hypothetical protein ACRDRI_22315 [Pseudonocardiaceae bacterium]
MSARRVEICRVRRQPGRIEVALPDWRMRSPVGVDQGRPATHPHPHPTGRWKAIYRTRGAVEREFGVLKHEWAMLPLRARRLPRVRLHVNLTILARLASALIKARAVPLAA